MGWKSQEMQPLFIELCLIIPQFETSVSPSKAYESKKYFTKQTLSNLTNQGMIHQTKFMKQSNDSSNSLR